MRGAVAAPTKKKKPDTPKKVVPGFLILWYNIIAKTIKPTIGLYHKNEKLSSAS